MIRSLDPPQRRLALPLAAGWLVLAAVAAAPAAAQDGRQSDRIFLAPGAEVEQLSWGMLREMTVARIRYSSSDREATLDPWQVRYVLFGDPSIPDNWIQGLSALRSENYETAVNLLKPYFNYTFREEVRNDERRISLVWTTHYYLGRAYLGMAQSIERLGGRLVAELQDAQSNERILARDLRGSVDRAIDDMRRRAGEYLDDSLDAAVEALQTLLGDGPSKARFVDDEVQAQLREVARAAARGLYSQAVTVLHHMFVNPPDVNRMAYSRHNSFWIFEMKLATAQALRGAGRLTEALSELQSRINNGTLAGEPIPQRTPAQLQNNPELIPLADGLAGNRPGFLHYVARAQNLAAEIFIEAGDYNGALVVYNLLRSIGRNQPEFEDLRNQADLNYGFTLSLLERGYERARSHLAGIVARFEAANDERFEVDYLLDPVEARKVAGAYLGLGDLAYREYQRARDDRSRLMYRQHALEAYLRVAAFFAADRELRAKALYFASRLYRDIANEWEDEWANEPREDEDGNLVNPYYYYLQLSQRMRTELTQHYSDTEWGQMQ